jgi:hypothetical protein
MSLISLDLRPPASNHMRHGDPISHGLNELGRGRQPSRTEARKPGLAEAVPGMTEASAAPLPHAAFSSAREKVLEHLFVADLLAYLWQAGVHDVEVLRPEVDSGGYDLVLGARGILRHVQLKSSHREAKTNRVDISLNLARRPAGCVIWMRFDPVTLELGPFLWFGDKPSKPLPDLGERVGKHSKGDSAGRKKERPNMRSVRRTRFDVLTSVGAVADRLFGSLAAPEGLEPPPNQLKPKLRGSARSKRWAEKTNFPIEIPDDPSD